MILVDANTCRKIAGRYLVDEYPAGSICAAEAIGVPAPVSEAG